MEGNSCQKYHNHDIFSNPKGCNSADGTQHPFHNLNIEKCIEDIRLTQLIAMLITDGGISVFGKNGKHYNIFFVQKYKEPVSLFSELIKQIFGLQVAIRERKNSNYKWYEGRFNSKLVANQLFQIFGTENKLAGNKRIPDFVMNNKRLAREFLRVLYGAEGCIYRKDGNKIAIEIACKPPDLKLSYKKLLNLFDIESRIYSTKISILKKSSVEKFIREIGTLDCFKVVRGNKSGERKPKILGEMLSVLQNSPS